MAGTDSSTFVVENMTCGKCAARVTKAVHSLAPKADVDVDLATGAVVVSPAAPDEAGMARAIAEAGYPARFVDRGLI